MIPSHSNKRMAKHNRHAVHNRDSKDLEYDLTWQKRTSLNYTNDHLDVQVYVQIQVTRHSFHTRSSRHFQTRLHTKQFSTYTEKPDIANHFEIGLISLGITVVVEWRSNNFLSLIPASWKVLLQEESDKKMMFAKYQCSSSILQIAEKKDSSKKLCKPRMGGTWSKLHFIIG